MDDGVIGGFLRNDREMVVAEIAEFNGKLRGDLRTWVPSAADDGEWVRTFKGVSIPLDIIPEVACAAHLLSEVASLEKTVAKLPAGREEIRVGVQVFRGTQYAFIRRFYQKGGEWLPSSKGVSVPIDRLDDFMRLVDQLSEAASRLHPDSNQSV